MILFAATIGTIARAQSCLRVQNGNQAAKIDRG
jgi:hypothetical protein